MACPCGQTHGGVHDVDLFPYAEASCNLMDSDTKYFGWINSWRDLAGFPEHMEAFLSSLLTLYPTEANTARSYSNIHWYRVAVPLRAVRCRQRIVRAVQVHNKSDSIVSGTTEKKRI